MVNTKISDKGVSSVKKTSKPTVFTFDEASIQAHNRTQPDKYQK